jgi:cobalt-precorrin-5B (C1)-methyltransferase
MTPVDRYIVKKGKKMRYGYTTGSCAAAATKAAAFALFQDMVLEEVEIDTPKGWPLKLKVEDLQRGNGWAQCGIKKDGGDDPDVTTGLVIYSRVEKIPGERIILTAGEGVGVVTKPGLQIKPGQPAINPVPQAMIKKEISEVLPPGQGVKVILTVPGGKQIGERTFNPKLGIVGGISIIGTTGIVEPMSTQALKDTLAAELSILSAQGYKQVVLVPGNYGKNYALKAGKNKALIISYGNYLGFALEKCGEYGFHKIELIGDVGKLVKVAAGIFDTTGRVADARGEIVAAYAAYFGARQEVIVHILNSTTTEESFTLVEKAGIDIREFSRFICKRIVEKCLWYTENKVDFSVKLYSLSRGFLAEASKEGEN